MIRRIVGGSLLISAAVACATARPPGVAPVDCATAPPDASTIVPFSMLDEPPRPLATNPTPRFPSPSEFRTTRASTARPAAGTQVAGGEAVANTGYMPSSGEAEVSFVVDSRGCPEPSSLRVVSVSDSVFIAPVREVLPELRYTPARLADTPVRALIQWRFRFYQGS